MNEKEIDYNLLEVEKGNRRNGIYLKNHIQDQDNRIKRLYEENKYLKEDFKRHIDRINELEDELENATNEDYEYNDYNRGVNNTINHILNRLKDLKENK